MVVVNIILPCFIVHCTILYKFAITRFDMVFQHLGQGTRLLGQNATFAAFDSELQLVQHYHARCCPIESKSKADIAQYYQVCTSESCAITATHYQCKNNK